VHCLFPTVVHGYDVSCSCSNAGCPVGWSVEPFVNWPVKNTAHVHDVKSLLIELIPPAFVKFFISLNDLYDNVFVVNFDGKFNEFVAFNDGKHLHNDIPYRKNRTIVLHKSTNTKVIYYYK